VSEAITPTFTSDACVCGLACCIAEEVVASNVVRGAAEGCVDVVDPKQPELRMHKIRIPETIKNG
jgi:hypothetical protein